nr:integrase arm-type DNA-binding domain-containing protein [Sphingopyxis alaskensis]
MRYEVFDLGETCLGIRVNDKGRITFNMYARFPSGKGGEAQKGRRVLGDYAPEDDRGSFRPSKRGVEKLTLEAARQKVRDWKGMIAQGVDPSQEPSAGAGEEGVIVGEPPTETYKSVYDEFMKRHVRKEGQKDGKGKPIPPLRSAKEIERIFTRYVLDDPEGNARWRHRDFRSVRRADVTALLDDVQDKSGTRQADAVLAQLSSLSNWYASRVDDYVSPIVRGMKRSGRTVTARKRILNDRELRLLWKVTDGFGTFGDFVRFALLTAQRRTKLSQMKHDDVSRTGTWTIPSEDREKANAVLLKLSPMAMKLVNSLSRHASSPYVFPGRFDDRPFSGFSKAKAELDDAIETENGSPIEPWVLHDLRRTAKSLMARAKVLPHISERVLGHAIPGVEGVYDRYEYFEEKAAALRSLATLIARITAEPARKAKAAKIEATNPRGI